MQRIVLLIILAFCLAAAPQSVAQVATDSLVPLGDESANFAVTTELDGLDNPAGLVVRPGSAEKGPHELFVAESGAGRVIRIATDQPKEITEVVAGFAQSSFGEDPALKSGPMGLAFLTRTLLVVGGGGQQASPGVLSVYQLTEEEAVINAEQVAHTAGPVRAGDSSATSDGAFFGLAKTDLAVFSIWSDANQGWILKSAIEANRLAYLQPFATPKQMGRLGAPTGIAINPSPRPPFLVVAHMGTFGTPRDSTLVFYVPTSAALAMSLETGLNDIFSLAYSPTGQLYAADFSKEDEASGGVYRLDDAYVNGQQACQAVKIASVVRPTALAFTSDGTLYVTAFGASVGETQGVLLKITGNL